MRILLYGFMLLLLVGCASTPTLTPPPNAKILHGIFGVVADDSAQSGHFTWMQTGTDFTLDLYGPLGLGATELLGQAGEYTLKTADGKSYTADSPEALLDEVLGWSMPVSGFTYWLWGQPEPDAPFTQKDDVLTQDGWQITYTRSGGSIQKMVMLRSDVRVTVVITHDE